MDADSEPLDLVGSVGELDPVVVLLRDFLHRSGAVRAVAVVEQPGGTSAVVDCPRLAPVEVTAAGRTVAIPHALELTAAAPELDADIRQLPPFEVDPASGEIRSTIGGLDYLVDAVGALARALGGRSVALATFATDHPSAPLSITVRVGEDPVLSLGDEQFDL